MICMQGGITQVQTISVGGKAAFESSPLSMTSKEGTGQLLHLQDMLGDGKFVRAHFGRTAVLITFEDIVQASGQQATAVEVIGSSERLVKVDWKKSRTGEKEQKLKLRFQPGRSLKAAFLAAARHGGGKRMARFIQEELRDYGHKLRAVNAGCIGLTFSSADPDFRRKMRDPATLDKIKTDFVKMFFPDLPQEELLSAMTLQPEPPQPPAEGLEVEDEEDMGFGDNSTDASSDEGDDAGGEIMPGSRLDILGNGNIIQIGLVNIVALVKFSKRALRYLDARKEIDFSVVEKLVDIHWNTSEIKASIVKLKLKMREPVGEFVRTVVAKLRENLAERLAAFVEQQQRKLGAKLTAVTTGCVTLVFSGAASGFRALMEDNAESIKDDFVRLLGPDWDAGDVQVELLEDTSPSGSAGQLSPEDAASCTRPHVPADTMSTASQKVWEEIRETLLTCKICEDPFDQQERLPRVLPCQHTFCGPCIAKLDKGGELSCPNCRQNTEVSGTFPVELTRSALLECTEVIETAQEALCEGCGDGTKATYCCLDCTQTFCKGCCKYHKNVRAIRDHMLMPLEEAASSPSLMQQKVEMCQKHPDEKLKFYCKTCKSAICSSCVIILHKDRDGHDNVELDEVLEQVKHQIESHCESLDNIRESSLQPRAKMAATSLQETDASFKAAEQKIEDFFRKADDALFDQKAQAMEELRCKWKEDRVVLEDQAAATQSLVSSAKTSTDLGRTVMSVGLPSHIVAQEQELERAVQEARAGGEKPLLSSVLYKVDTDLLGLEESLKNPDSSQSVTSRSTGVPTATVTSSIILTPEFKLERDRSRVECTVWTDGKTLSNLHCPQSGGTRQSGPRPFAFLGTCGSVDLAQPALHYWTVMFKVQKQGSGDRCEFGLASLQTLDTCGDGQRISDHDINSATLVVVREENIVRMEGKNWSKDVDTPPPPQSRDVIYTYLWEGEMERKYLSLTLGFLYDNRQPQSPRVLVVETKSCRLLGVRRLSPSPDLRPVLRLWPSCLARGYRDALLQVKTGPAALKDTTAWQLQSLLEWMDREIKK